MRENLTSQSVLSSRPDLPENFYRQFFYLSSFISLLKNVRNNDLFSLCIHVYCYKNKKNLKMQSNRSTRCFKRFHHRCQQQGSLDNYAHKRILPHITEQYEFRITNRLLVGKILNPRRDKTIMDSLLKASNKFKSKNEHPLPQTPAPVHRRKIGTGHKQDTISRLRTRNETRVNTETTPTRHQTQNMERLACSLQDPDSTLLSEQEKENTPVRAQSKLRNNFVGRIMRNVWRDESIVAQTAVSTDLSELVPPKIHPPVAPVAVRVQQALVHPKRQQREPQRECKQEVKEDNEVEEQYLQDDVDCQL